VKDVKERLSLDFQGKTIDGLIEAASKKVLEDAKIEPEKKVKELQDKLATVQSSYREIEKKLSDKEIEINSVKINSEVYKHIPSFGNNAPALGQDDILQLMKANGYEFKSENGAVIAYRGGKVVQDKLSNPVGIKDVVVSFLKEKNLTAEEKIISGRGAGQTPVITKYGTLSEIKKHYEQSGKSLLGKEFADDVAKAAKENPEFAMDK
jgi:ribosomal protein S13